MPRAISRAGAPLGRDPRGDPPGGGVEAVRRGRRGQVGPRVPLVITRRSRAAMRFGQDAVAPCGVGRKAVHEVAAGFDGRPYGAVIRERKAGRRSKFSPTGTIASRGRRAAPSAMRAARS